jgi:hypothetical protein
MSAVKVNPYITDPDAEMKQIKKEADDLNNSAGGLDSTMNAA